MPEHDYKALLEQLLRDFFWCDDEFNDGKLEWNFNEGVGVRDRSSVEFENELKAIIAELPPEKP